MRTQVPISMVGWQVAIITALPPGQENIMKSNIDKKFSAHYDAVEAELKSSTVGMQSVRAPTPGPRPAAWFALGGHLSPPCLLNSQVL